MILHYFLGGEFISSSLGETLNFKENVFLGLVCVLLGYSTSTRICAIDLYQPTWESVAKHPSAADWFQDAKFGLWFHWGVYSVPAFVDEWYPRRMYIPGEKGQYDHHVENYGSHTEWPYHNFINGAKDKKGNWVQFAPKLKSQGGNLDPNEWANLFEMAGAKFAGPVAEHHDGFSMWDSKVNPWNAVKKGPKLDLVKEFTEAFRAKNLKILLSMHHAWNLHGYYEKVPPQTSDSLKLLYGQIDWREKDKFWLDKIKEIVDGYQPDYIWQDFALTGIGEKAVLEFLAHYYNKGIEWNKEVVASYNDGMKPEGQVHQYERGGPGNITYPYWLASDAISSTSWCYTQGIQFYSSGQMLHRLIDLVSKNGNMLLNISPMADGTIPQDQRDILLQIGSWLNKFGESIYSTRAWEVYGEGPTKMGGGSFTSPQLGNSKDIRFTRSKDSTTLYAISLGWPKTDSFLNITTLNSGRFSLQGLKGVSLLTEKIGNPTSLTYTQDEKGFKIYLPSQAPYTSSAYVFKLNFSGKIPSLMPQSCLVRNPYEKIEAESFDSSFGNVKSENSSGGGENIGFIQNNDRISFCSLDFKEGATSFTARVASETNSSTGKIEIRLDSANGLLVGTLTGSGPGGYQNFTNLTVPVLGVEGRRSLYLVLQAGYNIDWIKFSPSNTTQLKHNNTSRPRPSQNPQKEFYNSKGQYISNFSIDSNAKQNKEPNQKKANRVPGIYYSKPNILE